MIEEMLTYRANVYRIAKTKSEIGQEVKSRVLVYGEMPCRVLEVKSGWKPNIGASEGTEEAFKIVCPKKFTDARSGDQVETEGKSYTITRQFVQRDEEGVNHIVYFLIENV